MKERTPKEELYNVGHLLYYAGIFCVGIAAFIAFGRAVGGSRSIFGFIQPWEIVVIITLFLISFILKFLEKSDSSPEKHQLQEQNTKGVLFPELPQGMTAWDLELIERSIFSVALADNELSKTEFLFTLIFLKDRLGLNVDLKYIIKKFTIYRDEDNLKRIEALFYGTPEYYQQLAFKGAAFMVRANTKKIADNITETNEIYQLAVIGKILELNEKQIRFLIDEAQNYNPQITEEILLK